MSRLFLLMTMMMLWLGGARAESPAVVATIAPLHSLAAAVGRGGIEPVLLLEAGVSPHTYQLRPSEARLLARADLVVRIGPGFEGFLDGTLERLAPQAQVFVALDLPLPVLLAFGGEPAAEAHALEPEHEHAEGSDPDTAAHEHAHSHGIDPHIWLHPANAAAIGRALAEAFAALDPNRTALYRANAEALAAELAQLSAEIKAQLAPYRGRGFATAHDAFRYFAAAFDLDFVGAFFLDPELPVGAATRRALRAKAASGELACLAVEPQFTPAAVDALARETGLPVAVLDPLGSDLAPGPELYAALLRRNADALARCLAGSGSG